MRAAGVVCDVVGANGLVLLVPFPKPVNDRNDLDEVFFLTPFSFAEGTTGSEAEAEMPSSIPSPVIESGP